jgi:hypothetical protein
MRRASDSLAKGKVHALIGIIVGGLCALANVAAIGLMLVGALASTAEGYR